MDVLVVWLMFVMPATAMAPMLAAWLIPKRLRRGFYDHRHMTAVVFAVLTGLAALAGLLQLFPADPEISGTTAQRARSILIVWVAVTACAAGATLRVAKLAWFKALRRTSLSSGVPLPPVRTALDIAETRPASAIDGIGPVHDVVARVGGPAVDRALRVARWALAVAIPVFVYSGGFGPLAEEFGSAIIVGLGVVFGASGFRRRLEARRARRAGAPRTLRQLADHRGLRITAPAQRIAVELLREPLLPPLHDEEPLYPQSAVGLIGDRLAWFVEQQTNMRTVNPYWIALPSVAHATGLWLPGLNLPYVEVSDRASAPPTSRVGSYKLELESFNRALCASGADPRTISSVLHPGMMQLVLRYLPDGARLIFRADGVLLRRNGPTVAHRVDLDLSLLLALADAIPLWLIREFSTQQRGASYAT